MGGGGVGAADDLSALLGLEGDDEPTTPAPRASRSPTRRAGAAKAKGSPRKKAAGAGGQRTPSRKKKMAKAKPSTADADDADFDVLLGIGGGRDGAAPNKRTPTAKKKRSASPQTKRRKAAAAGAVDDDVEALFGLDGDEDILDHHARGTLAGGRGKKPKAPAVGRRGARADGPDDDNGDIDDLLLLPNPGGTGGQQKKKQTGKVRRMREGSTAGLDSDLSGGVGFGSEWGADESAGGARKVSATDSLGARRRSRSHSRKGSGVPDHSDPLGIFEAPGSESDAMSRGTPVWRPAVPPPPPSRERQLLLDAIGSGLFARRKASGGAAAAAAAAPAPVRRRPPKPVTPCPAAAVVAALATAALAAGALPDVHSDSDSDSDSDDTSDSEVLRARAEKKAKRAAAAASKRPSNPHNAADSDASVGTSRDSGSKAGRGGGEGLNALFGVGDFEDFAAGSLRGGRPPREVAGDGKKSSDPLNTATAAAVGDEDAGADGKKGAASDAPPDFDPGYVEDDYGLWSWCLCLPRIRRKKPAVLKVPRPHYRENPVSAASLGRHDVDSDSDVEYLLRNAPCGSPAGASVVSPPRLGVGVDGGAGYTAPDIDDVSPARSPGDAGDGRGGGSARRARQQPPWALDIDISAEVASTAAASPRGANGIGAPGCMASPHLGARYAGSWRVYAQHRLHSMNVAGSPRAMYAASGVGAGGVLPLSPPRRGGGQERALHEASGANEAAGGDESGIATGAIAPTLENLVPSPRPAWDEGSASPRGAARHDAPPVLSQREVPQLLTDVGALRHALRVAFLEAEQLLEELVAQDLSPLPESETIGTVYATSAVILDTSGPSGEPLADELLDQREFLNEALTTVHACIDDIAARLDAPDRLARPSRSPNTLEALTSPKRKRRMSTAGAVAALLDGIDY